MINSKKYSRDILCIITDICFILGLLSIGYIIYCLIYPAYIICECYKTELLFRIGLLIVLGGDMFFGFIMYLRGRMCREKINIGVGSMMIITSVLILSVMAGYSYSIRRDCKERREYLNMPVPKLISIARQKKDVYAIEAIIQKQDRTAVEPLIEILSDSNEATKIRAAAALALGELGGKKAEQALKQALNEIKDEYLQDMIQHALKTSSK